MPFKKGDHANPHGRPPTELTLKFQIQRKLKELRDHAGYQEQVETVVAIADDIVETYFTTTDAKDKKAVLEFIADRTEGKPHQTTDITTDGESLNMSHLTNEELLELIAKAKLSTGNPQEHGD